MVLIICICVSKRLIMTTRRWRLVGPHLFPSTERFGTFFLCPMTGSNIGVRFFFFHNSEARLDVYPEWWSAPDLHYGNAITTGVYNRMCLLVAFGRCLRVVRKWEQQHPGDRGAAVGVAVVVGGGGRCLCGPSDHTEAPGLSEQEGQKNVSVTPNDGEMVVKLVFWRVFFFFKSAGTLKRLQTPIQNVFCWSLQSASNQEHHGNTYVNLFISS